MNLCSRRRPRWHALVGLVLLTLGCASPLWKNDHYVVDGVLEGTTCRVTIDGQPFVGTVALGDSIQIMADFVSNSGLPRGQGVKALICRGLVLEFISPEGTLPAPGRYRIAPEGSNSDPGSVDLHIEESHITEGRWPFALTGIHLEGREGHLQLEQFTDSSVRGTFRAIVRRQPNGA